MFLFLKLSFSRFYVKETFDDGMFNNWHVPKKLLPFTKLGKWKVSTGECYGHEKKWQGLMTTQSHRDYQLYTSFDRPMNTTENDFVFAYTVRMNPFVDCSGQFVKIMDSKSDMDNFNKNLPFAIKFGPDVCGPSFKRTHIVIQYKGKEYETNHPIGVIKDPFTHSYELIIRKNNTFAVIIDGEVADEATLEERFDLHEETDEHETEQIEEEEEEEFEIKERNKKDFDPSFGHFESLGYLGIDVHQSCCGSLFDNFVVTDDENEANELIKNNFLDYRTQEARNCDMGSSGSKREDMEDPNDNVFGNKEQIMKKYAHTIDYSNFDLL